MVEYRNDVTSCLKEMNYKDLEDLVYRKKLTHDEISTKIEILYFDATTTGWNLPPRNYEIIDNNLKKVLTH